MLKRKPRELSKKFGFSALADIDLLALIIQKGTRNKSVYEICNSIFPVIESSLLENISSDVFVTSVQKVLPGGETFSSQLGAVYELLLRNRATNQINNNRFTSPKQLVTQLFPNLGKKNVEYTYGVYLNARLSVIKTQLLTKGTIDYVVLEPHDIFYYAIKYRCRNVILIHNHPSGDFTPSIEDIGLTKKLQNGANILNIKFLDHIIISKEGFYSFHDNNLVL